jgi:RNA polymerase sigma factor (sigma-70 family)
MIRKNRENNDLSEIPSQKDEKGTHIIGLKKPISQSEEKIADQRLWSKIRYGSEEAFKELFLKYNCILTKYGNSIIQHPEIVEDCIHDLFFYIWSQRSSLKDIDSVKYYLLVSFRRKIFRVFHEREKGQKLLEGIKLEYPKYEDFFENKFVTNLNILERDRALKLAVDTLPQRQKEALHYRYVQGLSYYEISETMGISYVSVRKLVSKAIKSLRKKLF